jgi:hypothetical protein
MADHLESIKALIKLYRDSADTSSVDNPDRSSKHIAYAEALESALREIEDSRARLVPVPASYGDLSDLPPEVMAQLNLTRIDELEAQLRDIVASASDTIDLDSAIIELYRRHRVVHERRFLMNKLYRMAQKELIESVEGKKGVYRVPRKPEAISWDDLDEEVPF